MTDDRQAGLREALNELSVIAMLPVYMPPKPEDEDDRYLLRSAVLELVDRASAALAVAQVPAQEDVMLPFPTTDAQRWASEFVRIHGGDEGLMLGWFANAIEHGRGPDTPVPAQDRCPVCGTPGRVPSAQDEGTP